MSGPVALDVDVGGLRLEAVEYAGAADRRTLVLMHEGLGSVGLWRGFPEALQRATERRIVAFSRFGHGRSAGPPAKRTPRFFHEEALEILPELLVEFGAPEPLLVGHSDGASIAIIHAAHHPVAGLALLAPHVFVEQLTLDAIRETRVSYTSNALRERMARHHDDPDAAFWGWCDVWLDPAFAAWSIEEEAGQVTAPTLLVQGGDDPYGTLAQLDRVEARVRGPVGRLVVPGGHSPHLENPEEVVEAIARFAAALP